MRLTGSLFLAVISLVVLSLTLDTVQSTWSNSFGHRRCDIGAVEEDMCSNTGDPSHPIGLCLPIGHQHTLTFHPWEATDEPSSRKRSASSGGWGKGKGGGGGPGKGSGGGKGFDDGEGLGGWKGWDSSSEHDKGLNRLVCFPPIPCSASCFPGVIFGSWSLTDPSQSVFPATATLICLPGYHADGSDTIQCQRNGVWGASSTACVPNYCGKPPPVCAGGNGAFVPAGGKSFGDFAPLVCDMGYEDLDACSFIVCQEDGTWSSSKAVCTLVDCGNPPGIDSGKYIADSTTYMSVAHISCCGGYKPSDCTANVVCQADGTWSATPSETCDPVDCGVPDDPGCGVWKHLGTTFLKIAVLKCPWKTEPKRFRWIICLESGWFPKPSNTGCVRKCARKNLLNHAVNEAVSYAINSVLPNVGPAGNTAFPKLGFPGNVAFPKIGAADNTVRAKFETAGNADSVNFDAVEKASVIDAIIDDIGADIGADVGGVVNDPFAINDDDPFGNDPFANTGADDKYVFADYDAEDNAIGNDPFADVDADGNGPIADVDVTENAAVNDAIIDDIGADIGADVGGVVNDPFAINDADGNADVTDKDPVDAASNVNDDQPIS